MTSPRTLLGPLTTTWTAPPLCSYAMAVCDTCTSVWYGQTCNPQVTARDFTDCWPPRSGEQASVDPGVMMGWGFYSPGIACPAGYTTVAMATFGGSSGWPIEYSLTDGETAAACCPSSFGISTIVATNTHAQTCVLTATTSSYITVQCNTGIFTSFSTVNIPATISGVVISKYIVFAPLYQLNFKASDIPSTQSSGTATASSGPSSGSTTTLPRSTSTVVDDTPSSSSGLSGTAKIGIGVGAAVGAVLLLVIAFLLWRLRRRNSPPKTDEAAAGIPRRRSSKKKGSGHPEAELGGSEVKELDGRPIHTELPTQMPSHRIPPDSGPRFRRSDQNWVVSPADGTSSTVDGLVSPLEPHHGAVFELEGDSTPRSNRSTFQETA
ncbi:hypothetical protein GQ53DRAFT_270648 [Thozetella sp. PMI_491]|nr:hypothetical protein GQ53DRAFT_270648 [Thozetella sp. PMI_491]